MKWRALKQRGDLTPDLPSMRCVGYRQAWAYLDGRVLREFRAAAIAATRQLAKGQLTWLRSLAADFSIEAGSSDALSRLLTRLDRMKAPLSTNDPGRATREFSTAAISRVRMALRIFAAVVAAGLHTGLVLQLKRSEGGQHETGSFPDKAARRPSDFATAVLAAALCGLLD